MVVNAIGIEEIINYLIMRYVKGYNLSDKVYEHIINYIILKKRKQNIYIAISKLVGPYTDVTSQLYQDVIEKYLQYSTGRIPSLTNILTYLANERIKYT